MTEEQAGTKKTETDHTPGPWEYSVPTYEGLDDRDTHRLVKHTIWGGTRPGPYGDLFSVSGGISIANTRLMSAAPDLYEALSNIENDDGSIPDSIWAMRNAALAKADGKGGAS